MKKLTTIEFIEKSILKHGDKFNYVKVIYINNDNNVTIICPIHGEFSQRPNNHINSKYGCTNCGIVREKNNKIENKRMYKDKLLNRRINNFYKKCLEVHLDKYDYSLVEYRNTSSKIKIICRKHGEFLQRASAHLDGQGCMGCRLDNRRTGLELFLERCIKIHGDLYDYSLIKEYNNCKSKVKVICKEHDVFEIAPEYHTNRGQGCPECKKMGLSKFINSSNEKHNNKYDYSLIKEYINNKEKVEIICKEHGSFKQRITDHLSGIGCPECAQERFRLSTDDFIKRAKVIHNKKYIYSNSIVFKSNKDKVEILCKKHGYFLQRVDGHLQGSGCPICKTSKGELEVRNFLLKNSIEFISQKRFIDCVYNSELPFDFYLPEYNVCIEYNGVQHYKPIEYFGGVSTFEYQVIRDKIKNEYCSKNNIHLIVIKYNELTEDRLSILLDNLHYLKQD